MGIEKRGFASLTLEQRRVIAQLGGKASQAQGKGHQWTADEARIAGQKGGLARRVSQGPVLPAVPVVPLVVLLLCLFFASFASGQTPVYFFIPSPNAIITTAPGVGTVYLTAVCACPRVDFYVDNAWVATAKTPSSPVPPGAPRVPVGAFYYGAAWKPTSGAAVDLHAYACSSLASCSPIPVVAKNGRSYVTRMADSVLANVRPILTPGPSTTLRRRNTNPEREPKSGPPAK